MKIQTLKNLFKRKLFSSSDENLINFEKLISHLTLNEEKDDFFKNIANFIYFLILLILILNKKL